MKKGKTSRRTSGRTLRRIANAKYLYFMLIIAVMVLFNLVSNWNSFFRALLYLTDPATYNLQQVLRSILFVASMPAEIVSTIGDSNIQSLQNLLEQLRYAILIIGMLPMMVVYPFVQKFFVRGLMIGSLKE